MILDVNSSKLCHLFIPFRVSQGLRVIEMEMPVGNVDTQDSIVVTDEVKTRGTERSEEHRVGSRIDNALASIFTEVELSQCMRIA